MKNIFRFVRPKTGFLLTVICICITINSSRAQWVTHGPGSIYTEVFALAISDTNLFAGTNGGVFLSTDNGTSWNNAGLTSIVSALAVSGNTLFAGLYTGGVYYSNDNGTSWNADTNGLANLFVRALAISGPTRFAGTFGGGVFRADVGPWVSSNNGMTNTQVYSFAFSTSNFFAGTGAGVFLSNDGTVWTPDTNGLGNNQVYSLAASGYTLFAGTNGRGIFRSIDNGGTWSADTNGLINYNGSSLYVYALAFAGTNIFAGTGGGVYLSTNNGASWIAVNNGMGNLPVYALLVSGTTLFAGAGQRAYQRPLSEMITSVEMPSAKLPTNFSIAQNYPNPFNPSTQINYTLVRASNVTLTVYDILGQQIATLLDRKQEPGEHSISWNALNVPSGVYFYRIVAGDYVQTKKMVLMK